MPQFVAGTRSCGFDIAPVFDESGVMATSVQYITNQKGKKTAVVLPIADYEKLLEDLDDLAVIADRHDEPTIPHDQFKAELKRDGVRR
jgi:hypothetical protein